MPRVYPHRLLRHPGMILAITLPLFAMPTKVEATETVVVDLSDSAVLAGYPIASGFRGNGQTPSLTAYFFP